MGKKEVSHSVKRRKKENNCVNLLTYITYVSIIFKLFIIIKIYNNKKNGKDEEEVEKEGEKKIDEVGVSVNIFFGKMIIINKYSYIDSKVWWLNTDITRDSTPYFNNTKKMRHTRGETVSSSNFFLFNN